jgi:hypothetical protein
MSLPSIRELKNAADIREVWAALGGGKLLHGRGQAFWRSGDGFSVSLNPEKGLWHDFVSGTGGDIVALVQTVRQCDFRQAVRWLADFAGMSVPSAVPHRAGQVDTGWVADFRSATWWKMTAEILAEWALDVLPPTHPERRGLTRLLTTIRLDDAALVAEYRAWREREAVMTAAMVHCGRLHDARVQRELAHWIRRFLDGPQTT